MITFRPTVVVLGISAAFVCAAERPVEQSPGVSQKTPGAEPKQDRPKHMNVPLDDDSIRVRLLIVETVQTDLGLSEELVRTLRDAVHTAEVRAREDFAKLQEILPPSQSFSAEESQARTKRFREFSEELKGKRKEFQAMVFAMLTPSQTERLKQIQLQAAMPGAVARPELNKALAISEAQRGKIRALLDQWDRKASAEFPDLRKVAAKERRQRLIAFYKRSDEARAEAAKGVLQVLTPQQRAKLEALRGKAIDLTQLSTAGMPAADSEIWEDWGR